LPAWRPNGGAFHEGRLVVVGARLARRTATFARAIVTSFVQQTLRRRHFGQLDAHQEKTACRANAAVLDVIHALCTAETRSHVHDVRVTAQDRRDLMRIKERKRRRSNNVAMNATACRPSSRTRR
jgi:hypothetical protein